MENQGKVIALCGKIASGKTYYANQIKEKENAIILSVDELTFYLFDNREGENYIDLTKRAIDYFKAKSVEFTKKGVNVILDIGLWKSQDRKEIREFFEDNSIKIEIHFVDIDDELWEMNISKRNKRIEEGNRGMDFYVKDSLKALVQKLWEEPSKEEFDVYHKVEYDFE